MKIYKLAHNTIDNDDYKILIKFLENRKIFINHLLTNKFFR